MIKKLEYIFECNLEDVKLSVIESSFKDEVLEFWYEGEVFGQEVFGRIKADLFKYNLMSKVKPPTYLGVISRVISLNNGELFIDGKRIDNLQDFDFNTSSQKLLNKLRLFSGREDVTKSDLVQYIQNIKNGYDELDIYDIELLDLYRAFLKEMVLHRQEIKTRFLRYIFSRKKVNENILDSVAKKLFIGKSKLINNLIEPEYINEFEISDSERRIFFVNKQYERVRVNSPLLSGILYDPVGTSEGSLINVKNRLCLNAEIVDGQLFLLVKKSGVLSYISIQEFYSTPRRDLDGQTYLFNQRVLKIPEIEVLESQYLSVNTSQIPFLNKCDSTRLILAAHMHNQAVPLVYASNPIIQTPYVPIPIYSFKDKPLLKYSKRSTYRSTNESKMGHIPDSYFSNGKSRLYANLLTAYMNFNGLEQEDAIVISETASKKLSIILSSEDSLINQEAEIGDKLTSRYGCKGVISKIIPDSEMPTLLDGTRIDVIQSPLAVVSRKSLGQYYEGLISLILKKCFIEYHSKTLSGELENFLIEIGFDFTTGVLLVDPLDNFWDRLQLQRLLEISKTDPYQKVLINGEETTNPVVIGLNSWMRLYFLSKKKHKWFSKEFLRDEKDSTNRNNKLTIDEMGLWALLSHGYDELVLGEDDVNKRRIKILSDLQVLGYTIG